MSKPLATRLKKAAPEVEVALQEVEQLCARLPPVPDRPEFHEYRAQLFSWVVQLETATGKLRRRWETLAYSVPELVSQRKRDLADGYVRYAATAITGDDNSLTTPRVVDKWIAANNPNGERDLATIRASLKRIGRLKPNPRGRPRKAKPK